MKKMEKIKNILIFSILFTGVFLAAYWNTNQAQALIIPPQFSNLLSDSANYISQMGTPVKPAEGVTLGPVAPWGTSIIHIQQPQASDCGGGASCSTLNLVPDYSKMQAWNSDGSRLLLIAGNGFWHLYNGNTYTWIKRLVSPALRYDGQDLEIRWSHTNPDVFYYVSGMALYSYSISMDISTVAHTFSCVGAGYTCANIHNGDEGNQSEDDRYWVFYAQTGSPDWKAKEIIVYDKQTEAIITQKELTNSNLCISSGPGACPSTPNWVGMSPSGNYVIIQWNLAYSFDSQYIRGSGTELFDRLLNYQGMLASNYYHGDVGYDINGAEVYVSPWNFLLSADNKRMKWRKLSDLSEGYVELPLMPSYHVSLRNMLGSARGWALMSTYSSISTVPSGWGQLELFFVPIDTTQAISASGWRRVGWTYSIRNNNYAAEPHATPNRDATKILWGSNWLINGGQVQPYVTELSTTSDTTPPAAPTGLVVN